ncbi:Ubiquitin-like domain superfamily [Sesbania bispinosa]|nr:Ubiquitin-like domain superfamily [Sesbania bispinosa]
MIFVQRGSTFSIEVGFFDTVLEIKEKVQKYQDIPISKQTLIFNNQVLQDDSDVWKCEILQNSRIQLIVASDSADKAAINVKQEESSPSTKIQLNVRIVSSKKHIPLEMDLNDTVTRLKERIHDMEKSVPLNKFLLHVTGTELHDHQLLRDCDVSDNTEIDVSFRPPPTTSVSGGNVGGSKKLKLMVLVKSGTKKIPVEVNASDNVGELRKELQKLHQRLQFHLPQDDYFFIYKQNFMDDDRSFRWHHVGQGDTIEIFNGSVTGGS